MAEWWDVKSGDGGSIAVWVEGEGSSLVLVHGSYVSATLINSAIVRLPASTCDRIPLTRRS